MYEAVFEWLLCRNLNLQEPFKKNLHENINANAKYIL